MAISKSELKWTESPDKSRWGRFDTRVPHSRSDEPGDLDQQINTLAASIACPNRPLSGFGVGGGVELLARVSPACLNLAR